MTAFALPIDVGGRLIGAGNPCFVIAEIGSNHNHDLDLAYRLIDAAADAGVDAVKIQTFSADKHYSRFTPGFNYLDNTDTFSLIQSLEIDRTWHQPLQQHAASRGIMLLSSPCDKEAVDELAAINSPAYKVASFDLTDLDLISYIAAQGKPVILSTGMADWMDIQRAVDAARAVGNDQIILLQCTSLYPAPPRLTNLAAMTTMAAAFRVQVGYSDHTLGEHISLAAVALGACVIEKHFTLDRTLPGPDHPFAIEPGELKTMMTRLREVEAAIGDGAKAGPRPEEREMFEKGRRSIHVRVDVPTGTVLTADMLCVKRPGLGIPPHLLNVVLGRKVTTDIRADSWLSWDML